MEIFISIVAVAVAFGALWLAADSQGQADRRFRSLLDGRIGGLRKEIETLSAADRDMAEEIAELQERLKAAREELTQAVTSVGDLTEDVAELRRQMLQAAAPEGRRRA